MQIINHNSFELVCYKQMPEWDFNSLPKGFRNQHNTKIGTWAKLEIFSGSLQFDLLTENGDIIKSFVFDNKTETTFIEPQQWHKVTPLTDDLHCQLSFYCEVHNYYVKKYNLTATHSAVIAAKRYLTGGKALDLGSGRGRNSLFLESQQYHVDAFDISESNIAELNRIIKQENLSNINAQAADITLIKLPENHYNIVVNTVVMMFLEPESIPNLIKKIQHSTAQSGINIIVCAMQSEVIKEQQLPFSFAFKPQELAEYYKDWELLSYEEAVGQLHRKDANGNFYTLPFVTLVARK